MLQSMWSKWKAYVYISLLIILITALFSQFGNEFDRVNVALVFLCPVLLSAVNWGIRPSFYSAVVGLLAFDIFFVPPYLNITVADLRYLISFGVYLSVAALTASLAARLKQQLHIAKQREINTTALYELSRQMSAIVDIHSLLNNVSKHVSQSMGLEIAIYLPDDRNHLVLTHRSDVHSDWGQSESEKVVAKLAFEYGDTVGYGTRTLRDTPGHYMPLRTEGRIYGVLALNLKGNQSKIVSEQWRMLEALGGLAASAIARAKLAEEAKIAHLTAESERMRTAILDSVSHELRTPLAAIIGSATGLIEGERLFSSEDRMELLITIRDGALRMNRLVVNLLSMVQLESGMLRLRNHWCDVEDLIGVTLSQVKDFQQHRKMHVVIPDTPPMVLGDEVLLEQMLVNIVSNAIKYSPDYSEITIKVSTDRHCLLFSVSDQGLGLADEEYEKIFDKFYRAAATKQVTGTGLGLAICKGIAELHKGSISGKRNEPQGTVITVTLPVTRQDDMREIPQASRTGDDNDE
ncbi:ATP-binding protein [Cohnella lupini]|nr:ATP-binding protein [Cohnella lupini]